MSRPNPKFRIGDAVIVLACRIPGGEGIVDDIFWYEGPVIGINGQQYEYHGHCYHVVGYHQKATEGAIEPNLRRKHERSIESFDELMRGLSQPLEVVV